MEYSLQGKAISETPSRGLLSMVNTTPLSELSQNPDTEKYIP